MNADEDAVSGGVGDCSARFQGNKDVAGSRFDHAEAFAAENRRQPAGCVKREDLFRVPGNRAAPVIVSPMSRIDDDRIELPGTLPIRRCAARQKNCDQQDCTGEREARDVENVAAISCFCHRKIVQSGSHRKESAQGKRAPSQSNKLVSR